MISSKVTSERELHQSLKTIGFERTQHKTDTGTFWVKDGNHILIPKSVQGFYPDWLLTEIHEQIGRLHLWSMVRLKH